MQHFCCILALTWLNHQFSLAILWANPLKSEDDSMNICQYALFAEFEEHIGLKYMIDSARQFQFKNFISKINKCIAKNKSSHYPKVTSDSEVKSLLKWLNKLINMRKINWILIKKYYSDETILSLETSSYFRHWNLGYKIKRMHLDTFQYSGF